MRLYERARGNGKIFGDSVFVCPQSIIEKPSYLNDEADVWQSVLRASKATGRTTLRKALVEFSEIENAEIVESHIVRSKITGGRVIAARVEGSKIQDEAFVRGDPGVEVIDCTVKDFAFVGGTAVVKGITLDRRMRVTHGSWSRPPRYIDLTWPEMVEVGVCESTDGYATIACTRKLMTDWIKKRSLWIKAMGWPKELGRVLEDTFHSWLDNPIPTN